VYGGERLVCVTLGDGGEKAQCERLLRPAGPDYQTTRLVASKQKWFFITRKAMQGDTGTGTGTSTSTRSALGAGVRLGCLREQQQRPCFACQSFCTADALTDGMCPFDKSLLHLDERRGLERPIFEACGDPTTWERRAA